MLKKVLSTGALLIMGVGIVGLAANAHYSRYAHDHYDMCNNYYDNCYSNNHYYNPNYSNVRVYQTTTVQTVTPTPYYANAYYGVHPTYPSVAYASYSPNRSNAYWTATATQTVNPHYGYRNDYQSGFQNGYHAGYTDASHNRNYNNPYYGYSNQRYASNDFYFYY